MVKVHRLRSFRRADDGAVLVEFAIVGPILIVLLFGIVAYGGYFWLSHAVQQVANDAARAAVGGLDSAERTSLAQSSLTSSIGSYAFLQPQSAHVTVAGDSTNLRVSIAYDASSAPFWAMQGLLPMPSSTITRQASIRLGGY
jgi:Flp pilus assembly protein TadG